MLSLIMVIGIITSVPVTVSAASESDLTFELNYDGESYSVTDCDEYASGEIVIPATHYGLPVTNIGESAFQNCESLVSVKIPDSVTEIGDWAFFFCYNLKSINIPDSITTINNSVFSFCSGLTSLTIPNSVTSIGNSAFEECTNLKSITIPNSVISIGESAFAGCSGFESIKIPNNVTSISELTFAGCSNLRSVEIPDSVIEIGYSAFLACYNLKSIIIPDSVTYIDNEAFSWCVSLEYVKLSNNLSDIWDGVFYYCTSLNSITIPESVTYIGDDAFGSCNISDVYYLGDVEQWLEISICTGNECLTDANIHFGMHETPTTPQLNSVSHTSNGVKVTWGEILCADSYIVYRKTAKIGWTRLGTTTENTFTDTKAKTGTTYYYTVKAQNDYGTSGYNKTGLKIKFVAAPKLTKIANESSGVRVYWSKVSGADGYYLYRRVAGSKSWTKVATIKKGSTTSYLDKKASAGKTYEYIIKCYDGSTTSAAAAKVIKIERLTVPKLVSAKSGKSGVTFKWGKVTGADGYYVYRKTGSGSWVKLTTIKGNTKVSYVDKSAKKGKTYTYTVKAYSGSYTSAYNTKGLKIKDKY